jgi:D-aspartate ligase
VVSLTARRTRQHRIDFGRSSTFVETIEQKEVAALACRFLRSLGYAGVAEVEFKYDGREQCFKLLDVNGRFWTRNALGAFAGADFPYLLWRQALGQTVEPGRARPGRTSMYGSCDVIAALQEIAGRSLSLRDYLCSLRQRMAFASFALDDPLPVACRISGRPLEPDRRPPARQGLSHPLAG